MDYIRLLSLAVLYILLPSKQISEEFKTKIGSTGTGQLLSRFQTIRRRLEISDSDENPERANTEVISKPEDSILPMAIPIQTQQAREREAKKRHVGYDDPASGIAAEDYFAAKALSGILANPNTKIDDERTYTEIAHKAYKIAKLMCDIGMNPSNRRVTH